MMMEMFCIKKIVIYKKEEIMCEGAKEHILGLVLALALFLSLGRLYCVVKIVNVIKRLYSSNDP